MKIICPVCNEQLDTLRMRCICGYEFVATASPTRDRSIKFIETRNGLEILIPSRTDTAGAFSQFLRMPLWYLGEEIIRGYMKPIEEFGLNRWDIMFLLFTLGWGLWGVIILFKFLWSFIGNEKIILNSQYISIKYLSTKQEVRGYGYTKKYKLERIQNLRINYLHFHPLARGIKETLFRFKAGAIEFDYGDRVPRFAFCVDEKEAQLIHDELYKLHNFANAG